MHRSANLMRAVLAASTLAASASLAASPSIAQAEAIQFPGAAPVALSAAQADFEARVAANADDDSARFALGVVQTLRAGERLIQSLYRFGLKPRWATQLPIVRLPVSENPAPQELTNEDFRQIVRQLLDDLDGVEKTLAPIESSDCKVELAIAACRLDFNGDGRAEDYESLASVLSEVTSQQIPAEATTGFVVALDRGDVHWLRGYCHVLSALCEMFLAYDTAKLHDYTAQLFFPTAKTRVPLLSEEHPEWWRDSFLDAIAFIHLLQFPVKEPERLKAAHDHLLAVVDQSRASWDAYLAETDDDREWIPNPKQKNAAIPGAEVTPEMITAWRAVLDEFAAVLEGEKLIPFWRGEKPLGLNLKRVFYEPTEFDLVLWVQGGAAIPYLEEGELTDPGFWRELNSEFRGQFIGFAFWVN
jgi:hypothetical protein